MKVSTAIVSSCFFTTVTAAGITTVLSSTPLPASAITYPANATSLTIGFHGIEGTAEDKALGEQYYKLDISQINTTQVEFRFINNPTGSSNTNTSQISEVYFQMAQGLFTSDAPMLNHNNKGSVYFTKDATPPDLPGGTNLQNVAPYTVFSTDYSAQATGQGKGKDKIDQNTNRIAAGESLGILFTLAQGKTVTHIFEAINRGDFRVGIHAQSFDQGRSASFVNVPEPFSILGSGLALGMGVLLKRESDKKRQRPSEKVAKSQVLG